MQVLVRHRVQWDITAAVYRRESELLVTPYLDDSDVEGEPLTEPVQVVWREPLVVAGLLPAGLVGVRPRQPGDWSRVDAADGVWLACAHQAASPNAPLDLDFVRGDGGVEPVPAPPELPSHEPLGDVTAERRAYALTVAGAIADDAARHPPPGTLRRALIQWFWEGDPLYLTIHLLADGDRQPRGDDAWLPLEWSNADREFARTDRVLSRPDVQRVAEALAATFAVDDDGQVDDGEAHVPAVIEIVRALPAELRARGLPLADRFAVSAAHFEGWGSLEVLDETASPELLAALDAHGELPFE